MKSYAFVVDGRVVQIIEPVADASGHEVRIEDRFHEDFVARLVEYDPSNPPTSPPTAAAPPPVQVTMRQARLALMLAGKLAAVTAAITSLPSAEREAAQIEWEYAATVDRNSAFMQRMAEDLQLDEAALDELFAQAASL